MQWQYRTILFEFEKDGLLGSHYVDEEVMERTLNEQGSQGWELVSVAAVAEGLLAFCKRPIQEDFSLSIAPSEESDMEAEEQPQEIEPVSARQLQEEEREHIRQLEQKRREVMEEQERSLVDEIKIG